MAYTNIKYRFRYETSKHKRDVKLDVLPNVYSGAINLKRFGEDDLMIAKEKSGKIRGTSLEATIQADTDFEYQEFYSDDNKGHLVKLLIDDATVWQGYIVSDQFSDPYEAPPYNVKLMATDGLGLLRNYDFELTGMVSRFAAIRYCLDKIGLGLGYSIGINLFEDRMATNRTMLEQLYFYAESKSGKDCYEVLEALLPDGCIISQQNNRWLIHIENRPQDSRFLYSVSGTYQGTETGEPVLELGSLKTADVYPVGSLGRSFNAAWKNFIIKSTYGSRGTFLRNSDFVEESAYWTSNVNPVYKELNGKNYVRLSGRGSARYFEFVQQSIALVESTSRFIFKIKYDAIGYNYSETTGKSTPVEANVDFQIKLVGSSATWYLHPDNGWVQEVSYISKQISTSVTIPEWKDLTVKANKTPESGIITVTLYNSYVTGSTRTVRFGGVAFTDVQIYTEDLGNFEDEQEVLVTFSGEETESKETVEVNPVDLPQYPNSDLYFENGNFIDISGAKLITESWTFNGNSGLTYNEFLALMYGSYFSGKCQVLKGTVRGAAMSLNAFITHAWNGDREFYVETGEWYILRDEFSVDLIEILGSAGSGTVGESTDPVWDLIKTDLLQTAVAVFYRYYNGALINKFGADAAVSGDYIIFPELATDIFDRSDSNYWSGLSIYDSNPRKWLISEFTANTLTTNGTELAQASLFFNDYFSAVGDILPIAVYGTALDASDQEQAQTDVGSGGGINQGRGNTDVTDSERVVVRSPYTITDKNGNVIAYFNNNAELYYEGDKKLETTAGGVKVTGQLEVDEIQSTDYLPGTSGFRMGNDPDGKSRIEVGEMTVRGSLFAQEFVVNQTRAQNGNMIIANSARVERVESIAAFASSVMTIPDSYLVRPYTIRMGLKIAQLSDILSLLQLAHVTVKKETNGLRVGQKQYIPNASIPLNQWFTLAISYYEDETEAAAIIDDAYVTTDEETATTNGATPSLLGTDNSDNESTFAINKLEILDEVAEGYVYTFGDVVLTNELGNILISHDKYLNA